MNSIKECRTLNNGVQIPCLGFGTYKAAEGSTSKIIKTAVRCGYRFYHEKRVRAIGVSNFLPHHIENLLESCEVVPAVDQLEFHPGYTQEAAVRYCQEHDILVQAWSPLGRRRVMDDELIRALAERHHVTQAQICLRYAFQKGIIPIPKASSEERMKNNQDIFGFELTKTEMQKLDTMPPVGWSGEHPDRERVSIE